MGPETVSETRIGAPLHLDGVTLLPLEHVDVNVSLHGQRILATARKYPVGVVLLGADGTRAVDETGQPLDLEELKDSVRGLRERLETP